MMQKILSAVQDWFCREQKANMLALVLGISVFLLLCWLIPAQGLTDDDDFYAPAGIAYFSWFQDFLTDPGQAIESKSIHRAFKVNKEHPPMAKWSIGFFEWLLHQKLAVLGSLDAARAGVAFFAALLAAFIFRFLFSNFGLLSAAFAVLALLSLPRFLFHSQVATLDVPIATMVTLSTIAFWWSLHARKWVWLLGLIFGIALGTKLNAPFVAFGFVCYFLMGRFRDFKLEGQNTHLAFPKVPYAFWAMLILSPLVFWLTWPHLWHDTFARLATYIKFHMNHYPILVFYQGTRFLEPHAPWHMPFNMAAGTIPLPLLLLGLLGTLSALRSTGRLLWRGETQCTNEDKIQTLLLIQMGFAIGIVAFSNVPKYGGEKLFMPFFPLFCILAGIFFGRLFKAVQKHVENLPQKAGIGAAWVCMLFLLGPGFLASHQFHGGYALSYYSEFLGGLRGATAAGYERTYYDVADKSLAKWLDQNVPSGAQVHFEPNHKEYKRTYKWLRKDGVISKKLKLHPKWANAEYIVLTHERRWRQYSDLLLKVENLQLVHEKRIHGVPLYSVYKK